MNVKPILFSTDMVRDLLEGRKTVTRRVVKPQPVMYGFLETHFDWSKVKAPYRPGDILYVRETWNRLLGDWIYKADQKPGMKNPGKWHPSIHMPREAARIFLRVKDVRVDRLQNIDYEGCKAEGIWDDYKTYSEQYHDALAKKAYPVVFSELWDSTIKPADYALYGWGSNPWVWVIEFERCEEPEGD